MTAVQDKARPIVLAAGGTGGHLFPALALAQELVSRGHDIHLMTDRRVNRYADDFPATAIHEIPSATLSPRRPARLLPGLWTLWSGYRKARAILRRIDAVAAVGFGGYPTVPPLMAAVRLGLATCVHEQNAVLGRANRLLASNVNVVAGAFESPKYLHEPVLRRYRVTGNPVRANARRQAAAPYSPPVDGSPVRLVVFGGSQGARVMSEVVPHAIKAWSQRPRLSIVQQCREEDLAAVRAVYEGLGVEAEISPFFDDLPDRIAAAHLVICRSGASTVSELAVIGRPAILVPLPHSLDQDQRANALRFTAAGGGWLVDQTGFTPPALAGMLHDIVSDTGALAGHAKSALAFGRPDAESALADVVEEIVTQALAKTG